MKEVKKIILSLGSNIGNREIVINKAIEYLKESVFLNSSDLKISSFYETEPFGIKEQNQFLNLSISGFTDKSAQEVIFLAKSIEYFLDRKNRGKWLEREIDIDIIFYGNEIIDLPKLKIPHPFMQLRKFVLIPTNEIESDFMHPIINQRVNEILSKCEDQSSIKKY